MAKKYKVEGGQGGKRGHSNMTHWETTEEIKERSKVLRRQQGKQAVHKFLKTGEQD